MRVVCVIAEYNPFHNGHRYHLEAIRRDLGEDTAVIAIMSGSFTQRGECAVTDKWTRAACAVEGGVNLVLELPFPYAMASAEFFAGAGVRIAASLGIADTLSFGSECGDIDTLRRIYAVTASDAYQRALATLMKEQPALGHAKAAEEAFSAICGETLPFIRTPNDILAVEYLRALDAHGKGIQAHTVRREGAAYHDSTVGTHPYPSATALRSSMKEGSLPTGTVPAGVCALLSEALRDGRAPCDSERLFPAVLSSFTLNKPTASEIPHDAGGGLYHRLRRFSGEATSLSSWIALSETKKFTRARLRRALWYSYFGVTSSDLRAPVAYTQLLGADALGLSLLKRMRKTTDIPILTKPSDVHHLSGDACRQKALADTADRLFMHTMPVARPSAEALRGKPYLKK